MRMWLSKLFLRRHQGDIDCHEVGKVLQAYLDGHIDAERARRIEAHLEECRRCGMESDTYERIKEALAAQRPEVPADSIERLREFGERLVRGEDPSVERFDR